MNAKKLNKNLMNIDKFDSKETRFYKMSQVTIKMVERLIAIAEEDGLTNSQQFLDFLDKINELSVKY